MTEDAKIRQALKSEISLFIRDASQELSCRVGRNLESNFLVGPHRLEELSQNGLLNAIVDQCRIDMQGLIEEFLSRTSSPQSRTVSPLDELPTAMEENGQAAPLLYVPGVGLDLKADGFGPLVSDGAAAYWPSEVTQGNGFPLPTLAGGDSGWGMDVARFEQFRSEPPWSGVYDEENVL
jgi:hypothetical protein